MFKLSLLLLTALAACFSYKENKKPLAYEFNIKYDTTVYKKSKDTIVYKPNVKLVWKDFKGTPKNDMNVAAISSVGFKYDANIQQNSEKIIVNIVISSFFIRPNSWKKETVTDYILQHEQIHFDLARVAAQQLKENLSKRKLDKDNFDKELQTAYKETWDNYRKLQKSYDEETNHSLNTTNQNLWAEKAKTLLTTCTY